ncbi:MAG: 30S ribosomal protein S2 [Candidatus Azambacteria bacterium]|nr:30S ribosomal protein S2 [Candidatus Azambacteria bacterium]
MEKNNNTIELDLETMALSGLHLGSQKSSGNPKMKPFIWDRKNSFLVIDLEKSKENLIEALNFLISIRKKGGVILFVGTGIAAKEITKKVAQELNMPFVTERWLGGTFTNFQTISKRVEHLKDLEKQKVAGEFSKYTKYEVGKLEEKMKKLKKEFGGLISLSRLPDAIWVSSAKYDKIAVAEAAKKNIPIVGIVNTNSDPAPFTHPIPANDTALNSVNFILNLVRESLINVKPVVVEAETKTEESKNK